MCHVTRRWPRRNKGPRNAISVTSHNVMLMEVLPVTGGNVVVEGVGGMESGW